MAVKSKSKKAEEKPAVVSQDEPKKPEATGSVDTPDTVTKAEQEVVAADVPVTALIKQADKSMAVSGPMIGGISTDQLRAALATQTEQRQLIKEFIQSHLVEGTDFGKIHVVSRDKCPDADRCTKSYHYSKAVLFKPGQEKIFSLFQITDNLERDQETYEMLPNISNLVAYKCTLYRGGQQIGHGRGSAVVGDNRRDANATIKIAEKRARMDACLSLGFSEYFTQDLDDPDYRSQAEMANQRVAAAAEAQDKDEFGLFPRDPHLPLSNPERAVLHRIMLTAGFSEQEDILELLRVNGIEEPTAMTSGQAREMMSKLTHSTFAAPAVRERPPAEPEDQLPPEPPEPPTPAPMAVDEDFKANVNQLFETVPLNERGIMWFKQYVAGKPWAKWDAFTDADWLKAYDVVQAILDGILPVDDSYIKGFVKEDETTEDLEAGAQAAFPDKPVGKEAASGEK